jgi:diguanylate cyclase (GGDEF)-like protein
MSTELRILLIDDDLQDRRAVIRALNKSTIHFDLKEASSAESGLKLLEESTFDLVLLDYRLPDSNAIDVLNEIRSCDGKGMAVIVVSQHDDESFVEQCLDAGAQDFLLKDEVSTRRLIRAVKQAQQRYSIEQALSDSHKQLRLVSERDPLTGLGNRRGFQLAMQSFTSRVDRGDCNLALLLLDLDDFKIINDSLGHDVGDQVLLEVAERLKQACRDEDYLCRFGGDEFVILMYLEREDDASQLANRIFDLFQQPIVLGDVERKITTSIGIAMLDDIEDPDESCKEILKKADIALYKSKHAGRNQASYFSEKTQDEVLARADMKRELQEAIEKNEFILFYQAKINSKDLSLAGAEALLRWQHPRLGLLSPASFIVLAEETGIIVEIGAWVLHEVCQQLQQWKLKWQLHSSSFSISINLSSIQLQVDELAAQIKTELSNNKLHASDIGLEITENTSIESRTKASGLFTELENLGVNLALDDFGTGYSSFQHLRLFPVNQIKIENAYIAKIGVCPKTEKLIMAMIGLAKILNLSIVAEGVETQAQADFCVLHQCDFLQGYLYSRPASADDFEEEFLSSQ